MTLPQIAAPPPTAPPGILRDRGSIVAVLECPRCLRRLDGVDPEQLRTMLECYRRECRQRWWAMALAAGLVEPQLAHVFSPELTPKLMHDWALPVFLEQAAYWQIKTTRNQAAEYDRGGSKRLLEHFRTLFRAPALGMQ